MSSLSSSSSSGAPPAASSRRLRLRFLVDGLIAATGSAVVVTRGLSQRGTAATASRKRSASSLQTASGRSQQPQAGSASLSSSSAAARSSLQSASTSSSSPPVPPAQSDFARAVPAHPDVVALRAEDAGPVIAAAAAGGAGASSLPNANAGSGDAALGSAASASLLASSASSLTVVPTAAAAPSLSSALLASMLNISQPDTAGASSASANQFPYSGPMLSRARVKPAFPVIIPSSATWFDMESIHSRERRAFPDWLLAGSGDAAAAGSRRGGRAQSQQSAAWYRDIRNAIVTAYRSNPRVFLTVTACRRQIAADAGAVTRIHCFLQQSGLINYHVDPGSVPLMGYSGSRDRVAFPIFAHNVGVNAGNAANAAAVGDSALSHLFAFSSPAVAAPATASSSSDAAVAGAQTSAAADSTAAASSSSSSSSAGGGGVPPALRPVLVGPLMSQDTAVKDPRYELLHRPHLLCSQCGAAVDGSAGSSGLRFVSRHDPSVLLCPDCFGRGSFPPLAVADDFLRVTASTGRYAHPSVASPPAVTGNTGQLTAAASSSSSQSTAGAASAPSSSLSSSSAAFGDWTPEETLRLLEALARYGDDDWDAVQEAVGGSRTVEDCCQHFLSLPIEDPFLDQYPHVASAASASAAAEPQQADSAAPAPVPFADAGNPILAQVAFLASTVSPAVAAAAAQAAILAFSKQQQPASDSNGQHTEQQPATDAGSAASSSHLSWSEQLLSQPQQAGSQAPPAVSAAAGAASQPLPVSSIPVVSAVCLSAAAVRARELCLDEERKLLRCVAQLVQAQMRKVEIKLNHLTELDTFLAAKQQDIRAFHQRALQRQQTLLMHSSRQQQQQTDALSNNSSSAAPAAADTAQLSAAVSS